MAGNFKIIDEEKGFSSAQSFSLDILKGLSSKPKQIPSKYLYDERGSWLFEQITHQSEYYPTKCELEILEKRKHDIYKIALNAPFRLVELGVGDARKTKVLLKHFLEHSLRFEYVIVDCCQERIQKTVASLQKEYQGSGLTVLGIVGDYSSALVRLKGEDNLRNIVLFLGSSIGNFEFQQTQHFLQEMWNALNDGDCVFIGFDLKKNIQVLQKAYNDQAGMTREFNLNLLDRLNRELEADFERDTFLHHSFYNPSAGRMESWLISIKKQTITFAKLQKAFDFDAWEGIHVENSYKYDLKEIGKLAETVGFSLDGKLIDSKGYFADVIWEVKKLR